VPGPVASGPPRACTVGPCRGDAGPAALRLGALCRGAAKSRRPRRAARLRGWNPRFPADPHVRDNARRAGEDREFLSPASGAMIADAHYHLDPRLETVERLLAQMREHRIGRVALIAAVSDPLDIGKPGVAFAKAMRRALQGAPRLGRILYCSTVRRSGRVSFLGKSSAIYPAPNNDAVEEVLTAYPDKFVGWIFLNPRAMAPVEEAERRFRHPGWIGVKAHPFWHRYPVASLDEVAALCQERDKPMLVHLGAGRKRGDFRHLPERFPRLKI